MGRPKKNGGETPPPKSRDIAGLLNKSIKKDIAKREIEADPTIWIKTGNDMLDLAISKGRGIPVGRITELNGLESTGKSLLCLHLMANAQKDGALIVLCDVENAYTDDFTALMGVNINDDKFIYIPAGSTLEDVYSLLEHVKNLMITDLQDIPYCLFILDSITQAPTLLEVKSDSTSEGGYKTSKSQLNSLAFNKITDQCKDGRIAFVYTAQHRDVLNAPLYGEKTDAAVGGRAPKFAASVRVKIKKKKKIVTNETPKEEIGVQVSCIVEKTRFNHPHKQVLTEIYYDSGFDNYNSWLHIIDDYGLIKKSGAWYKMNDEKTGEEISFQKKDWENILTSNQDFKEMIYNKIKDKYVSITSKSAIELDDNEFNDEDDI